MNNKNIWEAISCMRDLKKKPTTTAETKKKIDSRVNELKQSLRVK